MSLADLMTVYDMSLTMLSPVHIGSGDEIDPLEYVVVDVPSRDRVDYTLHAIDLPRLLARLTDAERREFELAASDRIAEGAMLKLRNFVQRHARLSEDAGPGSDTRWWAPCTSEIRRRYQAGLRNADAQLRIVPLMRDIGSGAAYIPGSSIKGALRTAWVSRAAGTHATHGRPPGSERDFEPAVLGYAIQRDDGCTHAEIRADPFRAIHVGDAALPESSTFVDRISIHSPRAGRGGQDPSGIQMFFECAFSDLDGEDIVARGRLSQHVGLQRCDASRVRDWRFQHGVANAIDVPALVDACNAFYVPRLEEELRRFKGGLAVAAPHLEAAARRLGPGEALIRLGRFSHRECVTVNPRGGMPGRWGTTRSLIDGKFPLGWAKIHLAVRR